MWVYIQLSLRFTYTYTQMIEFLFYDQRCLSYPDFTAAFQIFRAHFHLHICFSSRCPYSFISFQSVFVSFPLIFLCKTVAFSSSTNFLFPLLLHFSLQLCLSISFNWNVGNSMRGKHFLYIFFTSIFPNAQKSSWHLKVIKGVFLNV